MTIKVINYKSYDILNIALPLIVGELTSRTAEKIHIQNITNSTTEQVVWPVLNGKFKALVPLLPGENTIILNFKSFTCKLCLVYEPLKFKKFVRLVYIKCKDDDGCFQAPDGEDNSVESACNRIKLGARMLQTFTWDKLKEHKLDGKTFHVEEDTDGNPVCHVFTSVLSLSEARSLRDEELWSHFALELMNSNLRVRNDCKFLAFLSFTCYSNTSPVAPRTYNEILQMTKGQVALGGGGLALFGSACLHTWAQNLQEVPWRFGDKRKIDRMKLMDDSANRGWYWSCYSTGLGAALHELGHTFDLGHTKGGIMARGFDDIYKYFIIDMFYHDQPFQKIHNPHYEESSVQNCTVSFSLTSPVSWSPDLEKSFRNASLANSNISSSELKAANSDLINGNEIPWKSPNPPNVYYNDPDFIVGVGGAYWTRSTALILYYHKWFNNTDVDEKFAISLNGSKLASSRGIKVVEFRDNDGTAFHHLEFLDGNDNIQIDLKLFSKDVINHGFKEPNILVEDSAGNLMKCKVDLMELT